MTTWHEQWGAPAVALALGLAGLVSFGVGGQWWGGVGTMVVMAIYAGALVAGRRFEAVAVVGGQELDERRRSISTRAAAWSAYAVVGWAVVQTYWDAAHGHDGQPWGNVAALGALVYILSVVVLRRRQ